MIMINIDLIGCWFTLKKHWQKKKNLVTLDAGFANFLIVRLKKRDEKDQSGVKMF